MAGKKQPDLIDKCEDLNLLYEILDSRLNQPMGRKKCLVEKVSICPPFDPCTTHEPIAGYVLLEMLTKKEERSARSIIRQYIRASQRPFLVVKLRFCADVESCLGHYGKFCYEDKTVRSEDTANIFLNELPENINGAYIYFFKRVF